QPLLFGLNNQLMVAFKEDNTVAFKHLLLKCCKDSANDTQAIYTCRDLLEHLAFPGPVSLSLQYLAVPKKILGRYTYSGTGGGTGLWLSQRFFCRGDIDPGNNTFDIDPIV
ncbi:MCLN1 protein, partial [Sitta europaea]|nr:MCLN1 protein [Sitta europaea]